MFCMKCGAELNDSARFCYKCGEKVLNNSSSISFLTQNNVGKRFYVNNVEIYFNDAQCKWFEIFEPFEILGQLLQSRSQDYFMNNIHGLKDFYCNEIADMLHNHEIEILLLGEDVLNENGVFDVKANNLQEFLETDLDIRELLKVYFEFSKNIEKFQGDDVNVLAEIAEELVDFLFRVARRVRSIIYAILVERKLVKEAKWWELEECVLELNNITDLYNAKVYDIQKAVKEYCKCIANYPIDIRAYQNIYALMPSARDSLLDIAECVGHRDMLEFLFDFGDDDE